MNAYRARTRLSPLFRDYLATKRTLPPDHILLAKVGDFYEAFFSDAEILARVVEIALTKRRGIPMAGIPYHMKTMATNRLLHAGLTVVFAEPDKPESK